MQKNLYELSQDLKELRITQLETSEEKLKQYREFYFSEKSEYRKIYQLETNILLSNLSSLKNFIISYHPYNAQMEDDKLLKENYIRVVEKSVPTLSEHIRQEKIFEAYIKGNLQKDLATIGWKKDQKMESYRILSPGEEISTFLFGEKIYFFENLLKIPPSLQALDLFLEENYQGLANSDFGLYLPWDLFEVTGEKVISSEWFYKYGSEKQKNNVSHSEKILKLYKKHTI